MRRAETAFTEQLRRELFDGNPVPSLLVPPSQLKSLRLIPPERYLLSRVNGQRDVDSMVHVSPLQEQRRCGCSSASSSPASCREAALTVRRAAF